MHNSFFGILFLLSVFALGCSGTIAESDDNLQQSTKLTSIIEMEVVKDNISDDIERIIRNAVSSTRSIEYKYIKIVGECGDNPDPQSSSFEEAICSNNKIEIVFNNKLEILDIID